MIDEFTVRIFGFATGTLNTHNQVLVTPKSNEGGSTINLRPVREVHYFVPADHPSHIWFGTADPK
jgi:hypothetical protein